MILNLLELFLLQEFENIKRSKMNSIMIEMPVLISVIWIKEEVGHTFENYNLVSAGVVNKDNKLVGMITAMMLLLLFKKKQKKMY